MTTKELHGIYHELAFWKEFVKTDRFLNGWVKKVQTPELHLEVAEFVKSVKHDKVLDVGSGVVSILNGLVDVTAVDPLGDLYKLVFDYERHKLTAPLAYPAEEIPFRNEFDIVHISNALDHTQKPVIAYNRLINAVKPGGYLIVQGFENEGTFENWAGFHQNDLWIDDNKLRLDTKGGFVEYIDFDPHFVKIKPLGEKNWFIWIAKNEL